MTEKLPTIKLKGKDYIQVKDRVLFFNEEYENGSIKTDVKVKEDGSYAWFVATVTPDMKTSERCFIARSAGPVDEEKSYEKLETVAVGRALAFMGIGIVEGIASADEIDNFEKRKPRREAYSNTTPKTQISNLEPCDKCGGTFSLRHGTKGDFYGCSGYKNGCRRTLSLEDAEMWIDDAKKAAEVFKGEVLEYNEPPIESYQPY